MQDVRTKAVFSLAAAAQDAEMQSVDAKTASVAMTRCGNAFRAYLPAQEIAEGKALLKVEGNGFAAFDYTHPGKTSLAANQVRKLLVTPAFANPELLPNCYVVSPGETLYIPVSKAFGVWDAERTGCVFAEGNGYYPAAGYINIMSASGSGGGAEAGTSGYCWSASSAGKNGYALTYSVSAIKTEAAPSKTWACPVRCVKDVK